MSYERITCADVQVGDRIARTRSEPFPRVESISEGNVSRRLHLRWVEGDLPPWRQDANVEDLGTFNIRPRRTAKLWRLAE